jgi:hypothetical protein
MNSLIQRLRDSFLYIAISVLAACSSSAGCKTGGYFLDRFVRQSVVVRRQRIRFVE